MPSLWDKEFYMVAFPTFVGFLLLHYGIMVLINKLSPHNPPHKCFNPLNLYILCVAIFFVLAEITKDLIAFYGFDNATYNIGHLPISVIARMFWYFPFQMCSFVIIFTLILAICNLFKVQTKIGLLCKEYSFLMICCITGFMFIFNVLAPGVIYTRDYFSLLATGNVKIVSSLLYYYPYADWFLAIHNLIFHSFFASFGLFCFFMNKSKMTNKIQLKKICKSTIVVFLIIISASYCSCYISGHPGDLNYSLDFAKVITGFFFDDSKVPIPIRSLFAIAITIIAFCLWYCFMMYLDKKTNIARKLFFNKDIFKLY